MVSEGDRVRSYNSVNYEYVVVETDVERNVEVAEAEHIWRLPDGDVLLENAEHSGRFVVAPSRLVKPLA